MTESEQAFLFASLLALFLFYT